VIGGEELEILDITLEDPTHVDSQLVESQP
jgi:hypothetical protein